MQFDGYIRDDGEVGTRNRIAIIYTVECARIVAERIAEIDSTAQVIGFRSCYPNDWAYQRLLSLATHANTTGVIMVSLGCESTDFRKLFTQIQRAGKTVWPLVIQENGGTVRTVEQGRERVRALRESAESLQRTPVAVCDLTFGLIWDDSCRITEAVGQAVDNLVTKGVRILVPAHLLMGMHPDTLRHRSANEDVELRLGKLLERTRAVASDLGFHAASLDRGRGSSWTDTLGTTPFQSVLPSWKRPEEAGIHLIDHGATLQHSILSPYEESKSDALMATIACGAQVAMNLTNDLGFETGVLAPIIRICPDQGIYAAVSEDFDLGGQALTSETISQKVLDVSSGEATAGERMGNAEYAFGYKF